MDLGVWMSSGVWRHKCAGPRKQTWNIPEMPEGFLPAPSGGVRLFVAIRGHWRGYFRLEAFQWSPADRACPMALIFAPDSWTPIEPVPAPRPRGPRRYTTEVPAPDSLPAQ